jgi:hypothetical protein
MNAKVIIPSHYYFEGINIPGAGWEKTAIEYTRSHDHTLLDTPTVALNPDRVKGYQAHVMYFGENVPFKTGKLELPEGAEPKEIPGVEPVWEQYAD